MEPQHYTCDNDFPALLPGVEREDLTPSSLLNAMTQAGTCRVLCYSPRHDLTFWLARKAWRRESGNRVRRVYPPCAFLSTLAEISRGEKAYGGI
jgi:galactose-1-phosphate uridylyltransferase